MPEAVPVTRPVPQAASGPLVRLNSLKRYFDVSPPWLARVLEGKPRAIVQAVDGVDIEIARGETFSLVGESGCGKSTVARLVVGLYPATQGGIEFDGMDMSVRRGSADNSAIRRRMQMIFQDPYASLNPRWRVFDIIAEPIRAFGLAASKDEIKQRVDGLLRQVRLTPADGAKFPHEFSGGQRQRISIARALASRPEFLVCDEPTSALDVSVQAQILNLMMELQRDYGLTYLFISHNLAVVYHISTRVGVMYLGRLVEVAATDTLFRRPRHPYTRMLLDTIPDLEMTGRRRMPVAGEVPSPINPPTGCAFHPRCPFANDRCKKERPELLAAEGTRVACHAVEEGRLPAEERSYAGH
ncbi:ABC transporter ATP-binding protein [Reyranella sp. CPCC 100927]|uniref:ABC transporter ATP-binding protein n=1 Tax=Reyranella sp. CPCC 100927 TaxID=2599616 RepID=UPI0011B803D2|nr:oligopeptide/dipeptide ABC transporter ATP-binding protein [Reyranella sp. CPCC 100927]TWT10177.1 ATP-binding cassette domain-containing protein [Reyranella sp. CPCC 100927]